MDAQGVLRKLVGPFRKPRAKPTNGEILSPLGEPFAEVLCSMYEGEPQLGTDGVSHPLDTMTRVSPRQGMWIYDLVRDTKPENTLEIGLAYGFSTVYILAAIQRNGRGRHLAFDPFQEQHWKGIGLTREKILGLASGTFSFSGEDSIQGLARLCREGRRFGMIFIDGNHKFDDVLIDFSLASTVCDSEGHIVLDDLWMPSIQRVVSFIRRNRTDFTEIPTSISNIAVFRRVGDDKREWTHFVPF